jgi:antitoxin (DNA-binding transcriptional repressor) of toxin-antitoxin stability system
MRVVRVDEFRQNLAYFLELARQGETVLLARHGQVEALIRPARRRERLPEIGAAVLRQRAFEIARNARSEPHLVTWYDRPAAVVAGASPEQVAMRDEE